jgi:TPR repeat protein
LRKPAIRSRKLALACFFKQVKAVDFIRALELFRASAKQGYPFAFTALGNSYHEGLGVEENRRIALIWFLLGAEHDPNSAFMAQALMTEIPEKEVQSLIQKALVCQDSKYLKCDF